MDRVKFALRGADTAADALVRVNDAAAAAQAAGSLGLDLLLSEGDTVVLHGEDLLFVDGDLGSCRLLELLCGQSDILLIKLLEITQVAVDRQCLADIYEAVDRYSTLTAGSDGVDGILGTGSAVAADKDVGLLGLEGNAVMVDEAAVGSLGLRAGKHRAVLGALADSYQNIGAGNRDGLALVIDGCKSAVFVPHGGAAHKLNGSDLSVFADNGLGCPRIVDDNAVGNACVLLVGNGGHLFVLLKAVHVDAAACQTACRTGNIDRCVAAADYDDVAGQLFGLAAVDGAQEVQSAENALELFAGDVQLCGLLQTYCNIECLEAFVTQLLDGDIFADLYAAAELNAHLTQNVYLGLNDILADTEGRNAVYEHAAGDGFLIEHDGAVAFNCKEVCTGHTGRAGADDRDLLIKFLVCAGYHGRHIAMLCLHVLLGDELLDFVNGQGLIDGAAGAGVLAVFAADASAYRGERIVLLYELESVGIAALGGHLYVALDCNVRRAGDLAGCGAGGPGLDRAVLVFVILVPVIFAPLGVVGQLMAGILDGAFLGAELLTEADCACRAGLNALAACDALFGVGLCGVSGCGKIRRVEQLRGAQCIADTNGTVADAEYLVLAVDIGYLMYIALILGLLEDLHSFFIGYIAAMVCLTAVVGKIADTDAPFAFDIARALAADTLLLTA